MSANISCSLKFVLMMVCGIPALADEVSVPTALDRAISDQVYRQITSVLVSKRGDLLIEGYWNGANTSTLHDTRSATKTLVALAVGKAIEEGAIGSVHDRAFSFFDEHRPFRFSGAKKSAVTVRDLLTMSSALDCNDNVWESPGNEEHMYPARRWLFFVLDLPTRPAYLRDESGFGPFSYCTAGSFLLGQIVEKATGMSIDVYFEKKFQSALGIPRIDWDRSSSGEIQTGGGAEMRSADLLKLGELVLNRGEYRGQRVLDPAWIVQMTTPHVAVNDHQGYGYQIWRSDFACGQRKVEGWYLAGNGGNKVVIIRDLDLVAVLTSTLYGSAGMHEQTTKLLEDEILSEQEECQVAAL